MVYIVPSNVESISAERLLVDVELCRGYIRSERFSSDVDLQLDHVILC